MKRFYKMVTTANKNGSFQILLDGKPVKTPEKTDLLAPNEALANEVMQEWAAQDEKIIPDTMPLTQILSTKIDRVSAERQAMTAMILKYLDTDLLCYRSSEPDILVKAQEDAWNPALLWFKEQCGIAMQTTTGLVAIAQDHKAHEEVAARVEALDPDHFTILQLVVPATGSMILALMFIKQDINVEDLFKAIRVEEKWKAEIYDEEKYGPDPHQEKKDKALIRDLNAAQTYLKTL